MNPFSPYQIIEHNSSRLHLALPKWRRRFQFAFFRFFPFLLLGLTAILIINAGDMPKGMLYTVVLSTIIVSLIIFFKKYTVEVDINKSSIQLVQKKLGGTKQLTYLVADVEELTCKIRHGKYGGTFFSAKLKTGETIQFMEIPVLNMKRENTDEIIAVLEQITGLKTTMDLPLFGR